MLRGFVLAAVAATLLPMPAQARWLDGCDSPGNPPCQLCDSLAASMPLDMQCVWGANRRTTLREYLQWRLGN